MATKAAAASRFEMEERKEPKFLQLGEGEFAEGIFITMERIEVKGKMVSRYVFLDIDGAVVEPNEAVSFLGTYQIDSKLRPSDIGHFVQVMCTGKDQNIQREGNAMKTFNVRVSKNKVTGYVGTPADPNAITDADIPY